MNDYASDDGEWLPLRYSGLIDVDQAHESTPFEWVARKASRITGLTGEHETLPLGQWFGKCNVATNTAHAILVFVKLIQQMPARAGLDGASRSCDSGRGNCRRGRTCAGQSSAPERRYSCVAARPPRTARET